MAFCKNCDPTCFSSTSDKCVEYTGQTNPNLGVSQGDTVAKTLDRVVDEVDIIKERLNACGICGDGVVNDNTVVTNTDSLPTTSSLSCLTSTQGFDANCNFTVDVDPKADSVAVNFSVNNIPSDAQVLSSRVIVSGNKDGYPTVLADTKNMQSGLTLRPDAFPATIDSEVKIQTATGERLLRTSQILSPVKSTNVNPYAVNIAGSTQPNTQTEVNSVFDDRICNLQNSLSAVTNSSNETLGSSNVFQSINALLARIESLETQLANIGALSVVYTNSCTDACATGDSVTLATALEDLSTCCCANSSGLKTTNGEVVRLGNEIAATPTTP